MQTCLQTAVTWMFLSLSINRASDEVGEDWKTITCLPRSPGSAAAPHCESRRRMGGPCSPSMLLQESGKKTEMPKCLICRSLKAKVRAPALLMMASPIDLTSSPDEGEASISHQRGQTLQSWPHEHHDLLAGRAETSCHNRPRLSACTRDAKVWHDSPHSIFLNGELIAVKP